jgi:hypothetical protein
LLFLHREAAKRSSLRAFIIVSNIASVRPVGPVPLDRGEVVHSQNARAIARPVSLESIFDTLNLKEILP